jgi:hypothetical protein
MDSRDVAVHGFRWLGAAALALAVFAGPTRADAPVERFLAQLGASKAENAQAAAMIREQWSACTDCDPNEFLTQSLAVVAPTFRDGLDAYDADEYERCAERMAKLVDHADPFVAVHAAVYEIKALVQLERLVEAYDRINRLVADGGTRLAQHSYFLSEIEFTKGFCLLADLQYEEADEALSRFLVEHPEAPQRLTLAARQILTELDNREPGRIGEVADLMDYSGRRLRTADGGETVQSRQKRIVDLLDTLIKEAEEQEKNNCKSGSPSGQSGGKSGQMPSSPMQESRLPGGNPNEGELRAARRANPGDTWGSMPPAERERILQALRESFPPRYRQLVEQYYEQLAKQP